MQKILLLQIPQILIPKTDILYFGNYVFAFFINFTDFKTRQIFALNLEHQIN